MSRARYPRDRIEPVLLEARIPDSYRIMPGRYRATPLGTSPADSRFCSRSASYTVLYASPDFATAFIETVVRDRFMRRRDRDVALKEITERAWARISARSASALVLLDLRGDGCARIGAPTDAVHARNHAAGRALGKAVHSEHADVEGLVYASRLTGVDDGAKVRLFAAFSWRVGDDLAARLAVGSVPRRELWIGGLPQRPSSSLARQAGYPQRAGVAPPVAAGEVAAAPRT